MLTIDLQFTYSWISLRSDLRESANVVNECFCSSCRIRALLTWDQWDLCLNLLCYSQCPVNVIGMHPLQLLSQPPLTPLPSGWWPWKECFLRYHSSNRDVISSLHQNACGRFSSGTFGSKLRTGHCLFDGCR